MKKLFSLALFALLAIVVSIAIQPFHADAATTYVSDSFSRSVSNSWGSTSPGGTYALSGNAANFDVPSVVGQMTLNANKTMSAYLPVSVRDVDVKVRVKRDKSVLTRFLLFVRSAALPGNCRELHRAGQIASRFLGVNRLRGVR